MKVTVPVPTLGSEPRQEEFDGVQAIDVRFDGTLLLVLSGGPKMSVTFEPDEWTGFTVEKES